MSTPEILAAIVLPVALAVMGYFVRALNQAGEKTARIGETMSEAIKQMAVKIAALEESYRHQNGEMSRLRLEFHAHDELESQRQNETAQVLKQVLERALPLLERGVAGVETIAGDRLHTGAPPPSRSLSRSPSQARKETR